MNIYENDYQIKQNYPDVNTDRATWTGGRVDTAAAAVGDRQTVGTYLYISNTKKMCIPSSSCSREATQTKND